MIRGVLKKVIQWYNSMQKNGLIDTGFLGGSFQWWMGQIADASTWRDNIIPYKFDEPDSIPGW